MQGGKALEVRVFRFREVRNLKDVNSLQFMKSRKNWDRPSQWTRGRNSESIKTLDIIIPRGKSRETVEVPTHEVLKTSEPSIWGGQMSRDPCISWIWASKRRMEESFNFATCEVLKRSGSSIYGGCMAVIGELPRV
jgi:hypothetical protein